MRRWLIILVGLPFYTFVMMVTGSAVVVALVVDDWSDVRLLELPGAFAAMVTAKDWWSIVGPTALVLVALQGVFLIPMFSRRPPRERRGKSLTASLLVAGALAGALTMGLGGGVLELIDLIGLTGSTSVQKDDLWVIPLTMLAVGWIVWSVLLVLFVRGIWADRTLGRLVGFLFAGTVMETIVILPLDVMVRRRTDCYCGTGTFVALGFCGLATLWLTGPGVVIALLSHRHRRWRDDHCGKCGYPKGPSPGPRCAECGSEWGPAMTLADSGRLGRTTTSVRPEAALQREG